MRPLTIRIDNDLVEELDEEADKHGFSSRSEYIREVLRNHHEYDVNTSEYERIRAEYDERLDRIEERLSSLEESGTGSVRDTPPDDASTGQEEIAKRLLAADWGDVMYSPTDQRVEAAAAAFAELAEQGRAQTATLVEIAEKEDADVSAPNRLLSDLGAVLDEVKPPTRGSNRYEWTGSAGSG